MDIYDLFLVCTDVTEKNLVNLEGDYMRPGWTQTRTKSDCYNDITWDRDESREWLHEIGMKYVGN